MIWEVFWADWCWLILLGLIRNELGPRGWAGRLLDAAMVYVVIEAFLHGWMEATVARWL